MLSIDSVDFELSYIGILIEPPIDVNASPFSLLSTDSLMVAFTTIFDPDKSATLSLDLDTRILFSSEPVKVDVSLLVFSFWLMLKSGDCRQLEIESQTCLQLYYIS
ncbi:hypothetical protein [Borreliella bavariensis]|uniref:hypothetical protein n=1 Tax=Borreliella bavariensis TaxID=664662 RepID=UPI001F3CDF2E|nr:hypothetical protein [Borreliella bavariensis]